MSRPGDKKPVVKAPECDCIAYESADGDDHGACHCGHSEEEHTRNGCEGAAQ